MSPQNEFLNLIADEAEKNCNLDCKISLKELSAKNSIYAELGEGFVESQYYDKTAVRVFPVLFLSRHRDQQKCMENLCNICKYFESLKEYPNGETFSWMDTEVAKQPSKIGRDEDGTYHYSCILNCKIFY